MLGLLLSLHKKRPGVQRKALQRLAGNDEEIQMMRWRRRNRARPSCTTQKERARKLALVTSPRTGTAGRRAWSREEAEGGGDGDSGARLRMSSSSSKSHSRREHNRGREQDVSSLFPSLPPSLPPTPTLIVGVHEGYSTRDIPRHAGLLAGKPHVEVNLTCRRTRPFTDAAAWLLVHLVKCTALLCLDQRRFGQ